MARFGLAAAPEQPIGVGNVAEWALAIDDNALVQEVVGVARENLEDAVRQVEVIEKLAERAAK